MLDDTPHPTPDPTVLSPDTRYVLGLDIGTANVRAFRTTCQSGIPRGGPRPAPLRHSLDGAVPAILEIDPKTGEVKSYGREALDRFAAAGDDLRFRWELQPSLGQTPEDLTSPVRPGSLHFRWTQDEAFEWTEALLARIFDDLEERVYGQSLTAENGWAITLAVPAAWSTATTQRLQEILARRLQNDRIHILSETRAALAFHQAAGGIPGAALDDALLVMHFGAISTRVSRVSAALDGERISIRAERSYRENYGGADFDEVFESIIVRKLGLAEDDRSRELRLRARKLKEAYSLSAEIGYWRLDTSVDLPGQSHPAPMSLDRPDIEEDEPAANLVRKFSRLVGRSLQALHVNRTKVSGIVVAGGGASWYFVKETLQRLFPGVPVIISGKPRESVAIGAALAPFYVQSAAAPLRRSGIRKLLLEGRDGEAERASRELLEWEPDDAGIRSLLGYALLRLDRKAEGNREIETALANTHASQDTDTRSLSLAHAGRAWLLRDSGKLDDAEREYVEALAMDPENVLAHIGLGFVYHSRDRAEDAERCYMRALDYDEDARTALRYLSKLYLDHARYEDAASILLRLHSLGDSDLFVAHSLGVVYSRLGRSGEAKKWLREALKLQPDHAPSRAALNAIGAVQ